MIYNLLIFAVVLLTVGYFMSKSASEVIRANPYPHHRSPAALAAGRKASIAFLLGLAGLFALIVCFIRWAF
jgi:hypothetical protein